MKRSFIAAAVAGVVLVSLTVDAGAQSATVLKPVQFGVSAGVSVPSGDLSDVFDLGYTAGASIMFNPAMMPLGVRVDGAYNQWSLKGGGDNAHVTSVTGNLVYRIPSMSVTPYLIGGAGWYNLGGRGESKKNLGWNAGGGLSMALSGFDTFIEARYNRVTGDDVGNSSFIPIVFGVMF